MTEWMEQAACREVDPEMFHDADRHGRAVHVCLGHCTVRGQCRLWAHSIRPRTWDGQVVGGQVWERHGSEVRVGKLQPGPKAKGCLLCGVVS